MNVITKREVNLEEEGKSLYKSNKNYQTMANLMEHPLFKDFYNNFMTDKTDAVTAFMYMTLYKYVEKGNPTASPYTKIAMVHRILSQREMRSYICNRASELVIPDVYEDTSFLTIK